MYLRNSYYQINKIMLFYNNINKNSEKIKKFKKNLNRKESSKFIEDNKTNNNY